MSASKETKITKEDKLAKKWGYCSGEHQGLTIKCENNSVQITDDRMLCSKCYAILKDKKLKELENDTNS